MGRLFDGFELYVASVLCGTAGSALQTPFKRFRTLLAGTRRSQRRRSRIRFQRYNECTVREPRLRYFAGKSTRLYLPEREHISSTVRREKSTAIGAATTTSLLPRDYRSSRERVLRFSPEKTIRRGGLSRG